MLIETPFPERLLEFLEQERLLLPICRVRYPAEIIRSWELRDDPSYIDSSLPIETNPTRLQAAEDLYCKIREWKIPSNPGIPLESFLGKRMDTPYGPLP